MNHLEFAETIANLPTETQNAFFESLKGSLSEEEIQTIMAFVSMIKLFKSPAKYEAVKSAVCDALSNEFFGHAVERERKPEDPCNPVYMTTIL